MRAHAIPPEERVEHILHLLLAAKFGWHTTQALSREWGIAHATVRGDAAEALRAYRRIVERAGPDELRALLVSRLEFIGRDALERREETLDVMGEVHSLLRPDHRTARQTVVDVAELAGLRVHKHEVTVSQLSDEEIRAQLRAHGLEVRTIETTAEPALGQGEANASDGNGNEDAAGAPPSPPPER